MTRSADSGRLRMLQYRTFPHKKYKKDAERDLPLASFLIWRLINDFEGIPQLSLFLR